MTSDEDVNPSLRRTRFRFLSSSSCMIEFAAWIFFFAALILARRSTLVWYWLYILSRLGEWNNGFAVNRDSITSIFSIRRAAMWEIP